MKVTLKVTHGPDLGREVQLSPGRSLRVGHGPPAGFLLAGDSTLSRLHFSVECLLDGFRVHGFVPALLGSLVVSIVSWLGSAFVKDKE
jgi:hypothetical protein